MTWLNLAANREDKWVGYSGWVFQFTSGGSLMGLKHTHFDVTFLCMFGETGTWTDGLYMGSHDYQACQAGRWVIWLVPSLLDCCQPGKSGENKSMAPSSRPSMYPSVIKIRNILWWLLGDFSDGKSPLHSGDYHKKWPNTSFFFVLDQMLALNGSSRFGMSIVYSLLDTLCPFWMSSVFLVTGWQLFTCPIIRTQEIINKNHAEYLWHCLCVPTVPKAQGRLLV